MCPSLVLFVRGGLRVPKTLKNKCEEFEILLLKKKKNWVQIWCYHRPTRTSTHRPRGHGRKLHTSASSLVLLFYLIDFLTQHLVLCRLFYLSMFLCCLSSFVFHAQGIAFIFIIIIITMIIRFINHLFCLHHIRNTQQYDLFFSQKNKKMNAFLQSGLFVSEARLNQNTKVKTCIQCFIFSPA